MSDELVLEEVNEGPLVIALTEEVPPVVERDFARRVGPGFMAFRGGGIFVDGGQMIGRAVEQIGGAEVLDDCYLLLGKG
jgi:hypothetical protein